MDDYTGDRDYQAMQSMGALGRQGLAAGGKAFHPSGPISNQVGRTPPLRERIQEACKRASEIASNLSDLANGVDHPSPQVVGGGVPDRVVKDSTLVGDTDDLLRTIRQIEHHVSRLTSAISG